VDASDIIQETQLEALRRLQDFLKREPMSFRLWLRKIACERLLMARRQHLTANRRSVAREEPLADASSAALTRHFLAPGSTPSHKLGRHELVEQVRQAIARLAQTDREIVVMRNLELLTNHEVAQILGIDPAAASQRYGRALLKLRKLLTERGLAEVEL
jgi:RNA polymerase sigma-70 factor (ECF subfamily)